MNRYILVTNTGEVIENPSIPRVEVIFQGDNGNVTIHEPIRGLQHLKILCGDGSRVLLNKNMRIGSAVFRIEAPNTYCEIGHSFVSIDNLRIVCVGESGQSVKIGDSCLFARGVMIRASDGHAIFDAADPSRLLNRVKRGITIGNHVWVGRDVYIMKEVSIPDDCVIGIRSLVLNKEYQPNSIIAGQPAKTIKTGINWSVKNPERYINELSSEFDSRKMQAYYPYEEQAIASEKNGDIDAAIDHIRMAIRTDGVVARLHRYLGDLLLKKNDMISAEQAFKKAIELAPTATNPHVRLSYAYAGMNDYGRAAESMRTAIKLDAQRPEFYVRLGEWLLKKGDLAEAEKAMKTAIQLWPGDPHPHIRLSYVYDAMQNLEKAVEEMKTAIRLNDRKPEFHVRLGEWLFKKGDLQAAEQAMKLALVLDAKSTNPHVRLSHIYIAMGDLDKAVAEMEQAIRLDSSRPEYRARLRTLMAEKNAVRLA